MIDQVIRAAKRQVETSTSTAPGQGRCVYAQVECGMTPGDSVTFGRYPDGDYVIGMVNKGEAKTIVLSPDTMKDLIQAVFQMVQS